jgi:hypothetical protein
MVRISSVLKQVSVQMIQEPNITESIVCGKGPGEYQVFLTSEAFANKGARVRRSGGIGFLDI